MKNNKKNIILMVVVFILVMGLIKTIFFKETKKPAEQAEVVKEESFKTIKPVETLGMVAPKSVSYTTENKIILSKKTPVYKINNQKIDNILADKIAKSFGFGGEPDVREEGLVVYSNTEDNTSLDINKQTMTIKFSKNLLLYPIVKPINTIPVEEIIEKLKNIIVKNFNQGQVVKIRIARTEYETLAGPRFVTSTKEKSNIVKITANYEIDGLPVFSSTGFPIIARFATDGNVLNLSADLPFINTIKQDSFSVKTEEELKLIPAKEYRIVDVDGGKDYDLASKEEMVEGVNIMSGYLGYGYTPESKYLSPFVFFESNSKLPSGPVVVILSVPALKEEEYYKK